MSKYVLYTSIILNGILLMVVTGIVPFLLYLSVVINLILLWYTVNCVKKIDDIERDMNQIMDKTDEFANHLERIHELEMFYGDENLQSMISHSKELINEYIDMQEKYFDVDVVEEADEIEDDETEEDTRTQAQE